MVYETDSEADKNGFYRIAWMCSLCTETNVNIDFHSVLQGVKRSYFSYFFLFFSLNSFFSYFLLFFSLNSYFSYFFQILRVRLSLGMGM